MPIQISKAVANVRSGAWAPPSKSLLDIPEGLLTVVLYGSDWLLRKRRGDWAENRYGGVYGLAKDYVLPEALPEGLSAPGNSRMPTQVTVKDIPEYRIFLANSTSNTECRVLWFRLGGDYYTYDRRAIPDTLPYKSLGDYPVLVDEVLAKNIDVWKPTVSIPYQILRVTDWEVVVDD